MKDDPCRFCRLYALSLVPIAALLGVMLTWQTSLLLPGSARSVQGHLLVSLLHSVAPASSGSALLIALVSWAHPLALPAAERELSRARRSGAPLSLLALDLDRFKRVNDTYGHAAGDEVLASVVALIRKCLRKEDLLARYGGQEFVVVLPGAGQRAAAALAERIRGGLEHTRIRVGDHGVRITASIGVAVERAEAAPSLEAMLRRADEALYAAKCHGRNRVFTFEVPLAVGA